MATHSHQQFFKQVNAYFDKVYVVTIPRLKERQEHMTELLDGLDFEFVHGVDKTDLTPEMISSVYDFSAHQKLARYESGALRKGQVACALSHLEVYKKAIDNNHQTVLILEDDIDFIEEAISQFEIFFDKLPKDWEFAYLGYWKNEQPPRMAWLKQNLYLALSFLGMHKWSATRIKNTYPKHINGHVQRAGNHEGAYAYAITLEGCKKLFEFNQPIKLNADHLFSHLITNRLLVGYLSTHKFFGHQTKGVSQTFNSETRR